MGIVAATASNTAIVVLMDFQQDIARTRECRSITLQEIFRGQSFGARPRRRAQVTGPVNAPSNISVYVCKCGGGKSGLIPNSVRITPNGELQIALDNARRRRTVISQAPALLENADPGSRMFGTVR